MTVTTDETHIFYERGKLFQIPMILVWGLLPLYSIGPDLSKLQSSKTLTRWAIAVDAIGILIMITSMLQIYRKKNKRRLVTTNLFAITRHPMYHGMFIAALSTLFVADLRDPYYWTIWAVFVPLILIAGRYQEKETLARWGSTARIYYDRTPRFIFEWPWFWIRFLPF